MKTKFVALLGFLLVISVLLSGCSSTQKIGDQKLDKKIAAKLRINNEHGDCSSRITGVDGEAINDSNDLVLLPAGEHVVSFEFTQITDRGGGFSMSVNIFGNQSDVVTPRPGSYIKTVTPINLRARFNPGKLHYLDTSGLSFKPQELTPLEKTQKEIMGNLFQQQYLLTGSAAIREK